MSEQEKLTERMLSGDKFTYAGLCDARRIRKGDGTAGDADRLIITILQKLSRAGKIIKERSGNSFLWQAVPQ